MSRYETVIGLEIHCELKTKSKIFCSCPNEFGAEDNENVCPVCLGMPGTLPVLNEKVVEFAAKAGLALNCTIANHSKLDRKNYFYPDLPKAYQISQYDKPLCTEGYLDIEDDNGNQKRVRITRIHIEEDAGKLIHAGNLTHLDNNRCGVPLIEIVTEPDMSSATEAERFARKVRAILESAGISDCKMQEGSLRFDVNLSVHFPNEPLGTRTEMKNLNSFRSLIRSVESEAARQIDAIENGERVIQETRRWDDARNASVAMRTKEDAHDYRYFPDPDLVTIVLTDETISRYKSELPMLPDQKKESYLSLGLSPYDSELITSDLALSSFFEATIEKTKNPKATANFILGDVMALLKGSEDATVATLNITPDALAQLLIMVDDATISLSVAKKVLTEMNETGESPADIVKAKGLTQISDSAAIEAIVRDVLSSNPKSVQDIKSGKTKATSFVVGQVMKASKGAANPALVNELITKLIDEI
jgi:aspartyl-tRNA(Asn)/glutamyl-tRNA(Gln) amidotransferase subunit B